MYSPQDPYSQSQTAGTPPYPSQDIYAQQQQLANASPYPPQYPPQPGAPPYPPAYPPQQPAIAPYPSPYANMMSATNMSNPQARRAMINGIISVVLSLITLFALVGAAGLITGTFAIVFGFMGLNTAKQFPNNAGRGQAITGIVLGFVAWFLIIISFILRTTAQHP